MKSIKVLSLFFAIAMFALVSCKSENGADATASPAAAAAPTTNTVTPANTTAAEPAVPAGPTTTVEFTETEHDYGTIMEGEKVTYNYKFKNTGSEPLIISNAKGSCGCTVPQWPREPIAPGAESEIKVQFDSKGKGKVGGSPQSKRVTITANTDPVNTYLTIKGTVDKKEEAATPES